MKIYMIILLLLLSGQASFAQNWAEIFRQNKTQRKYLVQQVAGLQVYIAFIQKGYGIVRTGLGTVSQLKNGELSLHSVFFSGLKSLSPAIREYAKVPDLLAMEIRIRQSITAMNKSASATTVFNAQELAYISRVAQRFRDDSRQLLDDSLQLLSEGSLQLSEDERMSRFSAIHLEMEEILSVCKSFSDQVNYMVKYRTEEIKSIEHSRELGNLDSEP